MAYTTIDDPSVYFYTQLYTGNGTAIGSGGNAITNNANSGDFKPDWTWHKVRSTTNDHQVYDSSRGVKIRLNTNATNSDFTLNEGLQSFDTNGFTAGSDAGVNQSSQTFVAWQWKANGGTTSSNSDGSITSTVQANTTAGFSIVTYTGNSTAGATVGHGLGVVPNWIIVKDRDAAKNWVNYHERIGNDRSITLNTGDAQSASTDHWNNNTPTSSVFYLGDYSHVNTTDDYVAYCFAEIQGYSKFGSYNGNGNANGPFVYLGFKPAWLIIKRTDASSDGWYIFDSTRSPTNLVDKAFRANVNNAESGESIDLLSNGFKHRIGANNNFNNASGTYIYMAFAESPFVSSKGAPTTAR